MRFPGLPGPYAPHHTIPYPPAPCPCPLRHEVRSSTESPIHPSQSPASASVSATATATAKAHPVPRTASVHLHGQALPDLLSIHTYTHARPVAPPLLPYGVPPVGQPATQRAAKLTVQHPIRRTPSACPPEHGAAAIGPLLPSGPHDTSNHHAPPLFYFLFPQILPSPRAPTSDWLLHTAHLPTSLPTHLPTQGYFGHSISEGKRHATTYSLTPRLANPHPSSRMEECRPSASHPPSGFCDPLPACARMTVEGKGGRGKEGRSCTARPTLHGARMRQDVPPGHPWAPHGRTSHAMRLSGGHRCPHAPNPLPRSGASATHALRSTPYARHRREDPRPTRSGVRRFKMDPTLRASVPFALGCLHARKGAERRWGRLDAVCRHVRRFFPPFFPRGTGVGK